MSQTDGRTDGRAWPPNTASFLYLIEKLKHFQATTTTNYFRIFSPFLLNNHLTKEIDVFWAVTLCSTHRCLRETCCLYFHGYAETSICTGLCAVTSNKTSFYRAPRILHKQNFYLLTSSLRSK